MAGAHDEPRRGNAATGKPGGRNSDREQDDAVREAYATGRRQTQDDLMLDVRFSNGSRCALSYSFLVKIEYLPADQVKLRFGLDTVLVEGRRLLPLYEMLRRHRTRFVQEGTVAEDELKPEEASHIDLIQLTQNKEEDDE